MNRHPEFVDHRLVAVTDIDPKSIADMRRDESLAMPYLNHRFAVDLRDCCAAAEFEAVLTGVEFVLLEYSPFAKKGWGFFWFLHGYRFDNGVLVTNGWMPNWEDEVR